jgi:hypothetical protein
MKSRKYMMKLEKWLNISQEWLTNHKNEIRKWPSHYSKNSWVTIAHVRILKMVEEIKEMTDEIKKMADKILKWLSRGSKIAESL